MILRTDIQKCRLVQQAVERELSAPNFTTSSENTKEYRQARYLYVFLCRDVNISFSAIRETLPVYSYEKTVYQLFRRVYFTKRNHYNYKWTLQEIRKNMKELLLMTEPEPECNLTTKQFYLFN